jgi:catechol 2,3-dioxygenase-like lactoylglutathione lyase family enzyme
MSAVGLRLRVTGVDHVVLHVADLAAAKRFYTEVLGMEVRQENARQAFLRCGTQQVGLFTRRAGGPIHAGDEVNHLALRLESGERDEVKAALKAAGVAVSGRPGDPDCLYFQDPDGHRLQVITPAEQH